MKRLGFCMMIFPLLMGCSSTQAIWMSDADVEQAVKLIESKDIRGCFKVVGSGTLIPDVFGDLNGSIEGFALGGKNLTTQECVDALKDVQ